MKCSTLGINRKSVNDDGSHGLNPRPCLLFDQQLALCDQAVLSVIVDFHTFQEEI